MRFQTFEEMICYYSVQNPDAPAIRYEQNGEQKQIGYAAFDEKIEERAEELRKQDSTCIGIVCDGTFACVTEIFAAVRAKKQIVLLNQNAEEEQIIHADVDCIWGDEEIKEEFAGALTGGVTNGAGNILFFTSGTTSKNKAVLLTEESLCASAHNGSALLPLSSEDVLLCVLPLDHVFGFVCGLLWGLSCGACVALGRGARHYADDCDYYKPTAVSAVPLLIGFFLQRQLLNPELKLVLIGAGDCPKEIPAALAQAGIRVSFGYGLTETSSGVALSLGEDPYAMTVCPDDTIKLAKDGEILISAPSCMMQGYYKNPEATEEILKDGVLHTGDLGRFDENKKLHVTGRKKEVLVLKDGTKLFLPEYEKELMEALPGKELAVIESGGYPALAIVGEETEKDTVQEKLAPVMKKYPNGRQIHRILWRDQPFPRTATGKIKRWAIQSENGNHHQ